MYYHVLSCIPTYYNNLSYIIMYNHVQSYITIYFEVLSESEFKSESYALVYVLVTSDIR